MELWCQNLMVLSSLLEKVLRSPFLSCYNVILVSKVKFLMQEYFLTFRAFLPCHIEGSQDYEEE